MTFPRSPSCIALSIDACKMRCPMPLLKAKQALATVVEGDLVEVFATDPGSMRDFRSFTDLTHHQLIDASEVDGTYRYIIKKG